MFSKYWRNYPWFLQLILFIIMIFVVATFFVAVLNVLLPKLTTYSLVDIVDINESSPHRKVMASLTAQLIIHLGTFMIPALLFANLTHPKPFRYLGLRKPGKSIQWLWVILLMLGAIPVMIWLETFFASIGLGGAAAKTMQEKNEALTNAYLTMPDFGSFAFTFLVMAIVPALGEEMLFRGIFMRLFHKARMSMQVRKYHDDMKRVNKNHMVLPLLLSAIIFAAMHSSVYGFLSIFIAGLLLGLIYYLTGSLWCSILAHLINNGLQIAIVYFGSNSAVFQEAVKANTIPFYLPIIGAAVSAGALYMLRKDSTPLPPIWSVDFTAEELAEIPG